MYFRDYVWVTVSPPTENDEFVKSLINLMAGKSNLISSAYNRAGGCIQGLTRVDFLSSFGVPELIKHFKIYFKIITAP